MAHLKVGDSYVASNGESYTVMYSKEDMIEMITKSGVVPPDPSLCHARTMKGEQCPCKHKGDLKLCSLHAAVLRNGTMLEFADHDTPVYNPPPRCSGISRTGLRCRNHIWHESGKCRAHRHQTTAVVRPAKKRVEKKKSVKVEKKKPVKRVVKKTAAAETTE